MSVNGELLTDRQSHWACMAPSRYRGESVPFVILIRSSCSTLDAGAGWIQELHQLIRLHKEPLIDRLWR
jgi:hypothetical protein